MIYRFQWWDSNIMPKYERVNDSLLEESKLGRTAEPSKQNDVFHSRYGRCQLGSPKTPCVWMQLTTVCLTGRRTNDHSVKTYGLWPIMSPELGSFHPTSKVIHWFVVVGWHHSSARKGPGPCVLSWSHSLIIPTSIQLTQNLKWYHK